MEALNQDLFHQGWNCSQSVFGALAPELGLDQETALRISGTFGGGMGRMQETCGAVTGALMALGYAKTSMNPKDKKAKEELYIQVRQLFQDFEQIHGATKCRKLLGDFDLKTPEGQLRFKNEELHEKICSRCVATSISLARKLLVP